jgi:hypothetical protein
LLPNQNYKLIDDETKVKDIFMLKCPTDAPATLAHLFDYQLTILNTIRIHDEQLELNNHKVLFLLIFPPLAEPFLDPR